MKAISRALDQNPDLNDVAGADGCLFARDGVGVASRGVAARVPIAEVAAVLASIDVEGAVGRPLAMGAIPFIPGSSCELIIPRVVVGKGPAGERWLTVIDGDWDEAVASVCCASKPPRPAGGGFSVRPGVEIPTYLAAVAAARDAVRAGEITKAVIARDVIVQSDSPIDIRAVMRRLRASYGSSFRYSIDGLVGASPELLVQRHGDIVRSHPLAGTVPRTGDPAADAKLAAELIASIKNQVEHRVVIDVVRDTLLPWCSYLDWQTEPTIMAVANVQHLATFMEGRLSQPAPSALELARELSPTPALGGHPRDIALKLIATVEGMQRGRYGGAVGWVDSAGDGTWAVAIRCAEIKGSRARLFAGGGIVAESDPYAELAETQAKFQAMLSALVRP